MAKRKSSRKETGYYQLKMTLLEAPVPIWRRLVITSDLPLDLVHEIFQLAMGWSNYHLHQFECGGKKYADLEEAEGDKTVLDHRKFSLQDLLENEGEELLYRYDFGDDWRHRVVLERIIKKKNIEDGFLAHCVGGKRACPPEDVGGVWGYAQFIEAIEDPDHEDGEEKLKWVGCDFDPDSFDARLVNLRIDIFENNLLSLAESMTEEELMAERN